MTGLKEVMCKVTEDFVERFGSTEKINNGGCFEWASEIFADVPGTAIHGKLYKGGFHAFIAYRKRYYDSETPQGVKDWRCLPYFKRLCYNH